MLTLKNDSRLDKLIHYMRKERYKTIYLLVSKDNSLAAKYCQQLKYPYVYNVPSDLIDDMEAACDPLTNYRMLYYRNNSGRPYVFKFWALNPFEPKTKNCYIWQLTMVTKGD